MGKGSKREPLNFMILKKFQAAVLVLAFFVVMVGGMMSGVSLTTLCVRSLIVWGVVAIITRIVVQILVTNEEMSSDQG